MKPMIRRGYVVSIEYSDEDQCFVGRVVGMQAYKFRLDLTVAPF